MPVQRHHRCYCSYPRALLQVLLLLPLLPRRAVSQEEEKKKNPRWQQLRPGQYFQGL